MKTAAICICNFNKKELVLSCLSAVLEQTLRDFDIYICDNGSTDGSLPMCRTFAEDAPMFVRVLQQPRRGACCARNLGLQECHTEWVCFFDSDDLLTPSFLADLMPLAGDADLLAFPTLQRADGRLRQRAFVPSASPASQLLSSTLNTASMLFRTDFLRRVGGWNRLRRQVAARHGHTQGLLR